MNRGPRSSLRSVAVLAVTLASATAAAAAAPEHQFGPAPSWADYRALVEGELRNRLVDPDSAKIFWLGSYYQGYTKSFLAGRYDGYVACGRVNARNRMGGYTGFEAFVAVVDYGRVLDLELARSATDQVTDLCVKASRMGLFPSLTPDQDGTAPVPTATTATSGGSAVPPSPPPDAVLTTASGLMLRAMPEGAYVAGVAAGSAAARAGLAPGMVVAAVNGVALAGMGPAAPKVVDAAGGKAALTLVGGRTLVLGGGK